MKKDEKIQEVKKEKKLLSPKLDIIFQVLFGEVGSEKITKTFLEAILERRIENIDLSGNIVLRRENLEDKMGVLDVLAKLNDGEYCNIEMQMVEKDRILERMLYYWARIYTKNLKNGYNYDNLKRTIEVLIVNFEIREMKDLEYHTKWKIIEEKYRKSILTEDLEIHIIILPRINKMVQTENEEELMKWLNFIEEPESEKVGKYMKENEGIKEAKEKLQEISEDERVQKLAELRKKAIMDEKAIESFGRKIGLEEGIKEGIKEGRKKGIKEGIKEGKKEGIKEGKKEGRKEGIKQMAKNMKEEGLDIELIAKITKLSKEEIQVL